MSTPMSDRTASMIARWVGGGGAVSALVMLAAWQIDGARQDSKTALSVVAQHGEEFVDIRHRMNLLEARIAENTASMKLGKRFTADDGDRLQRQIDSLRAHLERLEERIAWKQSE